MNKRQQLEQTIIGTVVSCNCFTTASFLVNEKNFSVWGKFDYGKIWVAFQAMHPTTVIDLVTIIKYLPPDYVVEICSMTNRIASGEHLQHHCLILFELDLRAKFIELLNNSQALISISELPSGTAEKISTAIESIKINANDEREQILTTITDAITYLQQLETPDEIISPMIAMNKAIDTRMDSWRRQIQLQAIFIALEKLTFECTGNKLMALKELAKLTASIALSRDVHETVLFEINKINKLLK